VLARGTLRVEEQSTHKLKLFLASESSIISESRSGVRLKRVVRACGDSMLSSQIQQRRRHAGRIGEGDGEGEGEGGHSRSASATRRLAISEIILHKDKRGERRQEKAREDGLFATRIVRSDS